MDYRRYKPYTGFYKMIEYIFLVDDYVTVNNKRFALNLNIYRNTHHYTLNQAKINFKENLYRLYPELLKMKFQSVVISYTVSPCDKRLFDLMNVLSIVDKFFCDALVQSGAIPDDNYKHVSYGEIKVGEIDKNNDCKKIVILCNFL